MQIERVCRAALLLLLVGCGTRGAVGQAGRQGEAGAQGPPGATGPAGPAAEAGASAPPPLLPPGGRLVAEATSCSDAPPVQLADVARAAVLCYVPYASGYVPVGGMSYPFSTLTLTPTSAAASAIFDVFAVAVGGAAALCWNTNAWTSTTARADAIMATSFGYYVNAGAIAACENDAAAVASAIPAGSATYLGSFTTTAVGTTEWLLTPDPAAGGTNNVIGVYNAYNHVQVQAVERELTSMWLYGNPTGTWEEENHSPGNRITILDGLGQSQILVTETMTLSYATGTDAQAGSPGICQRHRGRALAERRDEEPRRSLLSGHRERRVGQFGRPRVVRQLFEWALRLVSKLRPGLGGESQREPPRHSFGASPAIHASTARSPCSSTTEVPQFGIWWPRRRTDIR